MTAKKWTPIATKRNRKTQSSASIQGKPTLTTCTGQINIINPVVTSKGKLPKSVDNKFVQGTVKETLASKGTRRPGRGHLGHSGGWQNTEGNHTHSAIHFPIQQELQTRGMEKHGSNSSAPPTPQRFISMEHGKQGVQPGIALGRTRSNLAEDFSQRDRLQRPYGNHQRLESYQAVQTPGGGASRIRENQATIQTVEEQLTQTGHTQIPSGSRGAGQISSPVASHHSETNRSVAKSHLSSQLQEASRRRQGYKGKNKTTFSQREKESDPMIEKMLDFVKEVHKNHK
ncbi:hypothetical protein O181_004198 [Austropuccinia psidii MF-1]|uniref:Uncharacterized protein n=1 Tax=Austropuccinia psidii MF-1 TaxID=1389203 RepID=A0A9Q3GEA7_9BASI|nr:hypothetical protein [Austropuccinia psidii MF-1]